MTYGALEIGRLFTIMYDHEAGTLLKCDARRTIALHSGQLVTVHPNKKVEPLTQIGYSKSLFIAEYRGSPVIARKLSATAIEVAYYCITKTDFCRNPAELKGIPYGSSDEVDIILTRLKTHLEKSLSLADTLATLRET